MESPAHPISSGESSPTWTHWIVATVVAAVAMIGYVHAFIYPRTEGQALEKRVDKVEDQYREDIRAIRERLDQISDQLRR